MIPQRIMALCRCDKITRDQFGALMDQLIKRVLPVGARLTPDNRTGLMRNHLTVTIHILPVGLHIALLEIGRKTVHILIIRQNRLGFRTEEIVVPQADQRQQHRNIL